MKMRKIHAINDFLREVSDIGLGVYRDTLIQPDAFTE